MSLEQLWLTAFIIYQTTPYGYCDSQIYGINHLLGGSAICGGGVALVFLHT